VSEGEAILPIDSDMLLIIRDGTPIVRCPEHDMGEVPDDFVVLLGVSVSWSDPKFRNLMRMLCREASDAGYLDGIISSRHERAN
jgi:hypothetical protein